jgi:hypothetical protein
MEAQKLLDAAPFAPEIIKVLKVALEEAWASISSTVSPDRVNYTRMGLAHALVAHAAVGDHDSQNLKAAALEAVKKHPPRVAPSDP